MRFRVQGHWKKLEVRCRSGGEAVAENTAHRVSSCGMNRGGAGQGMALKVTGTDGHTWKIKDSEKKFFIFIFFFYSNCYTRQTDLLVFLMGTKFSFWELRSTHIL